ncbi:hypothetical protein PF010_g8436 [Phytophthora fragariae]|uniref:B box-type domain-containing protein n=1 Tax=Phytophthora fragariae TaxID=53985 RepID=A0A6G0LFE5_9STRA|nr:hypothetical protein PF010_g8436 [Phytophthora fragariae]
MEGSVRTASGIAQLFAQPSAAYVQGAQAASSSSPSGHSTAQQKPQETPRTPETASPGSDKVPTLTESEKGSVTDTTEQNGPISVANGGQSAQQTTGGDAVATEVAEQHAPAPEKKVKRWFEVIPVVLQNFRGHDREQINQLKMARCSSCIRSKRDTRAEFKCRQEGCILLDEPLCSSCWKTHREDGNEHRQIPASICPQCQLERIAYWCAGCDLMFCEACFDQIHNVEKAKHHRKLATEDAPGTCLAKSDWSASFQLAIMQLITARKHPARGPGISETDSTGGKRKREVEVIVIDDDDDDEMDSASARTSSAADETSGVRVDDSGDDITRHDGIESGSGGIQDALTRSSEEFAQLVASAQASAARNSAIEPIPFPRELSQSAPSHAGQTNLAYNSSSMRNGTNTVNISTSAGNMQWNNSASQFAASAPSLGSSTGSTGYVTSTTSNGMMEISSCSTATSMNMANGVWSTTSAISTDLASTSNPTNLLPLSGAVFAENALVDSLVDRYHEVNQAVTNLELQTEQLTRQIAVATCQGPYAAGNLMSRLRSLQPILSAERVRRDNLFIAMMIQSNDIMAAVRLLRLTELGDVPQVPMISHRKCLQITNKINHHKKKLIELNQELTDTLTQSSAAGSSWVTTVIRTVSGNIQMHEKNIMKLKKEREVEIVRIVQFSRNIREILKRTFQHSMELQRQQQQQQEQLQQEQFRQYG